MLNRPESSTANGAGRRFTWVQSVAFIVFLGNSPMATSQDVRIEHVQVRSPERADLLRDVTVEVHDGRIVSISNRSSPKKSGVRTIDGKGLYLAPGLIDSHVHLTNVPGMTPQQEKLRPDIGEIARRQFPRSFLAFGFTTLIDLTATPYTMARWKSQGLVPDTYFCGAVPLIDGYPTNYSPQPARYEEMPYFIVESSTNLPAGFDAAAHTPKAIVNRIKADGAICVKTFFDRGFDPRSSLPVPKLETVRALVQAAHAEGLPVLLHASTTEAQAFGLDAGVDIMAHGLWNWGVETSPVAGLTPKVQAVLDRLIAADVGWQPTFRVGMGFRDLLLPSFLSEPLLPRVVPRELLEWYGTEQGQSFRAELAGGFLAGSKGDPKAMEAQVKAIYADNFGRLERATRYMTEHHGRILFGTDTPCAPLYSNPPGLNGWWEMQALIAAGVSAAQIFRAATLDNAKALKLDNEIGTVEVGKRANLLLLPDDPAKSIQAYANINTVILGGKVLEPEELAANHQ